MTPQELDAIEARAQNVCNGFVTAKERNARDALRLVGLVRVRERQIEKLRAELEDALRGSDVTDFFSRMGL